MDNVKKFIDAAIKGIKIMTEQETLAKKLYKSPDFFIKYSAGRAIACFPYHPGTTYMKMGGESVCDTKTQAQAFLRHKSVEHAEQLLKSEEWETAD